MTIAKLVEEIRKRITIVERQKEKLLVIDGVERDELNRRRDAYNEELDRLYAALSALGAR